MVNLSINDDLDELIIQLKIVMLKSIFSLIPILRINLYESIIIVRRYLNSKINGTP